MKQLLFLFLVQFTTTSQANNYYVSATGNDANNGLTTSTPWATISKVNSFTFAANDIISFNRGDVFYGSIIVNRNNLSFNAYGTGALPIITGFNTLSSWTSLGGGIYEANTPFAKWNLNMVTLNDLPQAVGRYPNSNATDGGYLRYSSHVGNTQLTASGLSTTNWTGAEVVYKAAPYIIGRCNITSQSGSTITYSIDQRININPRNVSSIGAYTPEADNFGLFIQRDIRTLDQLGEWYLDNTTHKLKMYFGVASPSSYTIKASGIDTLINSSTHTFISVNNLQLEGGNIFGFFSNDAGDITVSNCVINFCGAKGIASWNNSNTVFDNNLINFSLENAIDNTSRFKANSSITGNIIKNTGLFPGMGQWGDFDVENKALYVAILNNATVRRNTIDTTGASGIHFMGSDIVVDSNFVNTFDIIKEDGGGIYTFQDTTKINRFITRNIVINGIGSSEGNPFPANVQGIYLDGGAKHVDIGYNTIAYIKQHKIYINSPGDVNVHNNTTYGSLPYSINKQYNANAYNFRMKNNIFANWNYYVAGLRHVYSNDGLNNSTSPVAGNIQTAIQLIGIIDSNYYQFSTNNNTPFMYYYLQVHNGGYTFPPDISFATWKSYTGHDTHSTEISGANIASQLFYYNASTSPKVIALSAKYLDVYGTLYNGSITLQPFSSAVLMYNSPLSGNIVPVANAGSDQVITLPTNSVTLSGSTSYDSDGTLASFVWTKVSGTGGIITNPPNVTTTVTGLTAGVYVFRLTVTDNSGATNSDDVAVNVSPLIIPDTTGKKIHGYKFIIN